MARRERRRRTTYGSQIPIVLSIAGSDSSAGAGAQADLKTFAAFEVYGVTALTCVVAEIPGKVSRIEAVSAKMVRDQFEVIIENFPVAAIKTGLLCSAEIVDTVGTLIRALGRARGKRIPLVIDPVIVATSGDLLLQKNAVRLYETKLFPLATVITPNLDEAERFLGKKIRDRRAMERAARDLGEKYHVSILLKGGHLSGRRAIDLLYEDGKITEFSAPFVRNVSTHGTGCTYSAAIAAGLSRGLVLKSAVERAKRFITACIEQRYRWTGRAGQRLDALRH
jgi:hydroxymethylpyrimidine/phosphomethylpyrimidine kinase